MENVVTEMRLRIDSDKLLTALYHVWILGFRALPHREQPKDEK